MNSKILAFETSCDDTCVAVVDTSYKVHSSIVSSQIEHSEYGGVVPEIASRVHLKNILPLTKLSLKKANTKLSEIDAFAVTTNPGLIGSLIVGLSFAKTLAYTCNKPFICVNHILAHVCSIYLENPNLLPPFLALIVSGGHTHLVYFETIEKFVTVGRTVDDAAGEAFDKSAKMIGLGFPGGIQIDRLAKEGDKNFHRFPRAKIGSGEYDFSYSGLKSSIYRYIQKNGNSFVQKNIKDISASIQSAIVEPLVNKTIKYAKNHSVDKIVVCGGVAANSYLRSQFFKKAKREKIDILLPKIKYCMDNAAMVGARASQKFKQKLFSPFDVNANSKKGITVI